MTTVTDAFHILLKTLCLKEFPCGNGNWRKQLTVTKIPKNHGKQVLKLVDKTEPQFSVTLKDYGASKEHIEILQEFVTAKHSPWTFDYSWSDEARSLREIAVKFPEQISDDFIYQHFKTLRITDKGVSEVDENLLRFTNLEYITLSANYIKNVNSKNLPRKLLSLELCANQVSELFSLCLDPPALVHLGLGQNCLTYVDDYLSGEHWPALLSLDLSFNNLTDLPETLRKLKTLPKLRNLILMGNPLMLTPGYRGFVIDNLPKVDLLDDQRIEADERHRYRKMSRLTEQELCQCKITFEVGSIKNIPIPNELKNADDQPDYPIITRNYYIEFHYIDDSAIDADVFALHHDAVAFEPAHLDGGSSIDSRDNMMTPMSEMPPDSLDDFGMEMADAPIIPELVLETPKKKTSNIIQSSKGSWAADVELNWITTANRDDLLAVRDFLQKPMKIDVVEETILSYPKEDEAGAEPGSAKKKKDEPKKEDKKGKKKKEPEQDMHHEPPEINVLASFEVSLEQFLTGSNVYSSTLSKLGVESRVPSAMPQHRTDSPLGQKKDKHIKSADKKGKDAAGGKNKDDRAADGKKSATRKDLGNKKNVIELDPDAPPSPLEIDVTIRMHHWSSTAESVQIEE